MQKFKIDKRSFPDFLGSYLIIIIALIFLTEIILNNFILGLPIGIIICTVNYFYTSHYWEFNENGIKIAFHYRKKTIDIDNSSIKLISRINNRLEGGPGFKIIIQYKSKLLQKVFLPSYRYFEPQSKSDFFRIKNYAIENKIPLEGDWNWN